MTTLNIKRVDTAVDTAWRLRASQQLLTILMLAVVVTLLLSPELALAQSAGTSFSLDKILPSSLKDKTFLEKVITVLVIMAIAGAAVIFGFGVMGGIGDVYSALSEARQRGEWAVFLKTIAFVASVLVVSSVLIALIIEWLNNFSISPTITIG
ncbi:MAG: hypothetical protein WAU60_08155 [Candidatus Competibacter denitrificans]|jgi:hypothetical protein